MRSAFVFCGCVSIAAAVALTGSLHAAPPKVNYLFPAGAARGQSAAITASGEFGNWPVQVWCSHSGVVVTADKEKGKLQVTVQEDVPAGVVWLRLYDAEGAAAPRPLIVGTLPEVSEVEPNDAPGKGQVVAADTVINGRLQKAGDVDGFAVELKKGETLTAAMQAHSLLGSPMDAVLQICQLVPRGDSSAEPNTTEAYVLEQNHDVIGLDPAVVMTVPRDGTYLVRAFAYPSEPNSNIAFAGGDNFVYRLTLMKGAFDPALMLPSLAEKAPQVISRGSNDSQPVELPALITGLLKNKGERQAFSFAATKGKKVSFQSLSHAVGLPTEPALRILDDKGATVADGEGGDPKKDLELVFTPPADGTFRLLVRDLFDRGGPFFGYRIRAAAQSPEFSVSVAADSYVLSPDKPLEIPLTIERRSGFSEPMEITAVGLPAGVTCDSVSSASTGDTAKAVKLVLKATGEVADGGNPFRIEAKSSGPLALSDVAKFSTNLPLDQKHELFWLTVKK